MRAVSKAFSLILLCGVALLNAAAQCPKRPDTGTIVHDALSLTSNNGTLSAEFTMRHSVDDAGYTHYCYNYKTAKGEVESPTLRLNPGDKLDLDILNRIHEDDGAEMTGMDGMTMPGKVCGDGGTLTITSTNVHFHGMNVPPKCHQDDVLTTIIQPDKPAFPFRITMPNDQPPGLYWYHPHPHGFTEFQVNGGAAGALVIGGMEKYRPEVAGLLERVFVIRQQFLVPWIPGPYELTFNYQVAFHPPFPAPIVKMKEGDKEFWRVSNSTNQDFMPLQVVYNGKPQPLQLIALDGYPLAKARTQTTILLPPAGRAEFIVKAPPKGAVAQFQTNAYDTGITGNPDLAEVLADIELSKDRDPNAIIMPSKDAGTGDRDRLRFGGIAQQKPTTQRKLYFSEKFGGTGGPIEFYITVDGQKPKVFEADEKPVITTHVGAVEDWTIENRALETHDFHIHQIHFLMLEVDGKPAKHQDMRDSMEIPFWEGPGHPYHKIKVRMDFRDPTIAGTFVFHCHILLHEDLGMMHKILVLPK